MGKEAPAIIWFRSDLRLDDNPALAAAIRSGRPVVPVFILAEPATGTWTPGAAGCWWLHHSLTALAAQIAALGGKLILRRGDALTNLLRLTEETGACALFFNRGYEPGDDALEAKLAARLGDRLEVHRHNGQLLFDPELLTKRDGSPYRIFSPFWRAARALPEPPLACAAPVRWPAGGGAVQSEVLSHWQLLPRRPDWSGGLQDNWEPGEAGAAATLDGFLERGIGNYRQDRDRPHLTGTSRLSPYLRWGELSPRRLWHTINAHAVSRRDGDNAETFLRELGWREFSWHLLHHFPTLPDMPLRPEFTGFPWRPDSGALLRWQKGLTGYPIVDAGMRELWTTGWMHNRVRMITASFLVKDLLLPWQWGARWFWDTLVDADLANNSANWQWVAGCGTDAAPFFRIFNPTLQGDKFDPHGEYVRRWLPELRDVPDSLVHRPWLAPSGEKNYPPPIVDHASARRRALAAFRDLRTPAGAKIRAASVGPD